VLASWTWSRSLSLEIVLFRQRPSLSSIDVCVVQYCVQGGGTWQSHLTLLPTSLSDMPKSGPALARNAEIPSIYLLPWLTNQ
jgi:hypothetical protein